MLTVNICVLKAGIRVFGLGTLKISGFFSWKSTPAYLRVRKQLMIGVNLMGSCCHD